MAEVAWDSGLAYGVSVVGVWPYEEGHQVPGGLLQPWGVAAELGRRVAGVCCPVPEG